MVLFGYYFTCCFVCVKLGLSLQRKNMRFGQKVSLHLLWFCNWVIYYSPWQLRQASYLQTFGGLAFDDPDVTISAHRCCGILRNFAYPARGKVIIWQCLLPCGLHCPATSVPHAGRCQTNLQTVVLQNSLKSLRFGLLWFYGSSNSQGSSHRIIWEVYQWNSSLRAHRQYFHWPLPH